MRPDVGHHATNGIVASTLVDTDHVSFGVEAARLLTGTRVAGGWMPIVVVGLVVLFICGFIFYALLSRMSDPNRASAPSSQTRSNSPGSPLEQASFVAAADKVINTRSSLSMFKWQNAQSAAHSNRQAASKAFAEVTIESWKSRSKQPSEEEEMLMEALLAQTSTEYVSLHDRGQMKSTLKRNGVEADKFAMGRQSLMMLFKEIEAEKCHLILMESQYVVRFVRILRVTIKANTPHGTCILVEVSREARVAQQQTTDKDARLLVAKLNIDEIDVEIALAENLNEMLGLSQKWQDENIILRRSGDPIVEARDSKEFPGLASWYLVEEIEVEIKDLAVKASEQLLGLPAGDAFTTQSMLNHNRMCKRKHHWAWMDHVPDTAVPAFKQLADQTNVAELHDSLTAWAEQAIRHWREQGVNIPEEVSIALHALENLTRNEYGCLNDPCTMEEQLQKNGVYIGADRLQEEIDAGRSTLLMAHDPRSIAEDPTDEIPKTLVRFTRLLRLRVKAKSTQGLRLLVGGKQQKTDATNAATNVLAVPQAPEIVGARFVAHKLRVDELDTEIATKELLFVRLGLSPEWQEKNMVLQKVHAPTLEVKESLEFPGLTSWYLVQMIDMCIKDDAVDVEDGILGLPEGTPFETENSKNRNKIIKTKYEWFWVEDSPESGRSRTESGR